MMSLFPYMGSKKKLVGSIIELLPKHTCYVEPFAGTGAVLFAKEPSKCEVLNDINKDITNLFRVVKYHVEEFHKQFKWILVSRENWNKFKETPAHVLTDIQRAVRFLYLQKLCYGGRTDGMTFGTSATTGPKFNLLRLESDLEEYYLRLSNVMIENEPWDKVIKRYDREETVFYVDPPYWKTAGYGVPFPWEEYKKLKELMESIKGKVIFSINPHPEIDELFKNFKHRDIDYKYTMSLKQSTKVKERVYMNFENNSLF